MVGNSLAGKGHAVPGGDQEGGDGAGAHDDGDGQDQEDDGAAQNGENLSAISLRASPRTRSDWWREASALKLKYQRSSSKYDYDMMYVGHHDMMVIIL